MYTQRYLTSAAVLIGMTAAVCSGQSITSAHSGTLHYFEGSVSIDGSAIESKVSKFTEIKENSVLSTGQGRAEILLTPGVFLRVGENSSIKMLDNRLLSTRVEFISGSAIVESDDPEVSVKDPAVTILYKDYQMQPLKFGLFEITSDPAQMKVFKGQANVATASERTTIKEGHLMPFSAALLSEKFDEKQADDLYLWTRDRSGYLSAANMSSARSLASNGYMMGSSYPGLGFSPQFQGGWYLNSALGMYTYMPYGGLMYNPFGYGFYSPGLIYSFYSPMPYTWYGGGGAPASATTGQPLSSLSTFTNGSAVSGSRISRLGSSAIHPTLGNPAPGSMIASRSNMGSANPAALRAGSVGSSSAVSSSSIGRSASVSSGSMGASHASGHGK